MIKRVALYARVSTTEQNIDMQLRDLRRYAEQRGWAIEHEYIDQGVSGSKDSRPALNTLMNAAHKRKFDAVVVWRFDRFARSTSHLLRALETFKTLGIEFISYQENLDTSSPMGQAMFTIMGALAQLERDILIQRVTAGLSAAKARGTVLGRPRRGGATLAELRVRRANGDSIRAIAKAVGMSKSTVGNMLSLSKYPSQK